MGQERLFGELRSLMQEAPSYEVWERVVEALDRWPEGTLEAEALPYVCDHLRRWPEAHDRAAPAAWAIAALDGGSSPRLLACATLRLQFAQVRDRQLGWLAACRHVRNLRYIDMSYVGQVQAEGMSALANSPNLGALASLEVSGSLGDGAWEALALGRGLPALRHLYASSSGLGGEALLMLRRGKLFARLTTLSLSYNTLAEGVAHLDGVRWESIEQLELSGCALDDGGAEALSRLDAPRLEVLSLSQSSLTERGVLALLGAQRLPALRLLEVTDCHPLGHQQAALVAMAALRGVSLLTFDEMIADVTEDE
jgi:hypothetical protein